MSRVAFNELHFVMCGRCKALNFLSEVTRSPLDFIHIGEELAVSHSLTFQYCAKVELTQEFSSIEALLVDDCNGELQ